MAIEDSKRWQWVVIGLLAGVGLSYAWTSMDPAPLQKSTKAEGFERELFKPPLKGGQPNVTNIVVLPPVGNKYVVKFDLRTPLARGDAWTYETWAFVAETPYRPSIGATPTTNPNETILTYLTRQSQTNKNIKFTYEWWRTPTWTRILWTGGSVLVIGGIWPTLLSLMVGAGFGRSRDKEPEYDLSRFGKDKEADSKPAAKQAGPTDEDLRRMRAIEENLEKVLGLDPEPKREDPAKEPAPAIRSLDAGPLVTASVQRTPEEEKEYRGEFYPTAREKKKA